ncbi:MAG: N-acetylmuramoyl-L-alanine amidase, partial [Nitrospirae bacterium]|nr:N-acetylmuramoyl-L-alanine amidase [Nitrospirota bacterium]
IHHSATELGNAQRLNRSHRRRGFSNGLGYHFVIDNGTLGKRDGQIEIGPRWSRQQDGAHCNVGGMNEHGIGICLVGDFTTRPPSPAQLESLAYLVDQLGEYYRIPHSHVLRHRDVPGKHTACPGEAFPWQEFQEHLD